MKYNPSRIEFKVELEPWLGNQFVFDVSSLYAHFKALSDQRKARGIRYQLADGLTLITLAKLGGEDGPTGMAEWLDLRAELLVTVLGLERETMPDRVMISRLLGQAVVVEEFDGQAQLSQAVVIAIDGKTLRGTIGPGQSQGLHLLAVYLPEEGLVLLEIEVETKENEFVAAPRLLRQLDLRGKSSRAMPCRPNANSPLRLSWREAIICGLPRRTSVTCIRVSLTCLSRNPSLLVLPRPRPISKEQSWLTMATLNNLVLALILHQGYACLPQARRRYAARPLEALHLIMQNPYQRL